MKRNTKKELENIPRMGLTTLLLWCDEYWAKWMKKEIIIFKWNSSFFRGLKYWNLFRFFLIKNHSRWAIVQAKIVVNKITNIEINFILTLIQKSHTQKRLLLLFESAASSQLTGDLNRLIARLFVIEFYDPLVLFSASFFYLSSITV